MSHSVDLECKCGAVKGDLGIVPGAFFHVHCLCIDCQRFATHLGNEAHILDGHGGTALFQTYPNLMRLTEGKDNVACVRLSEKGLFRWHTRCCSMPLANTMISAKAPFVGVFVSLMKFRSEEEKREALGPVLMKAFGKYSRGEMPADVHPKFPISYLPKIGYFMLRGMLGGKSSPSPFFEQGKPFAEITVLSAGK